MFYCITFNLQFFQVREDSLDTASGFIILLIPDLGTRSCAGFYRIAIAYSSPTSLGK